MLFCLSLIRSRLRRESALRVAGGYIGCRVKVVPKDLRNARLIGPSGVLRSDKQDGFADEFLAHCSIFKLRRLSMARFRKLFRQQNMVVPRNTREALGKREPSTNGGKGPTGYASIYLVETAAEKWTGRR